MNDFVKIQEQLSSYLEDINVTITESLSSSNTLLNNITDFFLNRKGKQIRPILTLLTASVFGLPNKNTINGAAALELLHNASLIHDDVVDNSTQRRSIHTINKLWGNRIAVLVGDYFVSSALQRALITNDIKIVSSIGNLGQQLSVGELDQINNSSNSILSEQAYIEMIARKTASLFVACAQTGCASVNAPEDATDKLVEFARLMGICFQIKDDIFDYLPQCTNNLGKPVGNDLLEGKITLPLIKVLLDDRQKGIEENISIAFKTDITPKEVDYLIDYARDKGGVDYAVEVMNDLSCKASEILQSIPYSEAIENLNSLFRYVIQRNY